MFNSLRYSKDLEAAGFSRQQAEAAIDVFYRFMEYNFATKDDIKGIHADIISLRQEFRGELLALNQEFRDEHTTLKQEFHKQHGLLRQEFHKEQTLLRQDFREQHVLFSQEHRIENASFRQGIQNEILELRHNIQTLEQRMTIKFGLMQTASIAILAAVIKLL